MLVFTQRYSYGVESKVARIKFIAKVCRDSHKGSDSSFGYIELRRLEETYIIDHDRSSTVK